MNIYHEVEVGHFLSENNPYIRKVSKALQLDTISAMIFSFLYFQEDRFTSSESLCGSVFHGMEIQDTLGELVKGGVLDPGLSCSGRSYRVSESYRYRVEELVKGVKEVDIVKLIATTPSREVEEKSWQDNILGQTYHSSSNRRFVEGFKTIGYRTMSPEAQKTLWCLLRYFITDFDAEISGRYNANWFGTESGLAELVNMGIAVVGAKDSSDDNVKFRISSSAVRLFFHGREDLIRYVSLSDEANLIRWEDIDEKELYFSEDSQRDVDRLRFILSREGFERAQGIFDKLHRKHAVISLFWGPPGTGKTEAIKQLARQSQRNIFLMDAAKLTATGWGETEKLYRKMFASYMYVEALSSNVPILLFNEADQFLCKRLTCIERAIDKSENVISNIILQSFEDFEGILMATTNLIENIDSAFDRRFLFKTKLDRPDAVARQKIWSFYIPELTQQETQNLADGFELTGSEICNIATKRALAELYETGDRGYEYIVNLCVTEGYPLLGKSHHERKRIGF